MSELYVKVCGITNVDQLEWAIELGYDAVGLMQAQKSQRLIDVETARRLVEHAAGRIDTFAVGLCLDEVEPIRDIVDTIQLYEHVEVDSLALASDTPPATTKGLDYWFYDASHGTGTFTEIPDWVRDVDARFILAGGLNPGNVAEVVARYRPDGVDVSSGVESSAGVKDYALMKAFIDAVRRVV
ncbi:MAG TPA: hypothetical protein H9822_06560 [Candidatus Yaniella excrementavium]|nr:hypothetical protein [Candidatus Yaniella excrementavium]